MSVEKASMSAEEQSYINGSRAFVVVKRDDTHLEVIADHISFTPSGDLLIHRPDNSIIHAFYHPMWKEAFGLNVLTGEPVAVESISTPAVESLGLNPLPALVEY